MINLGNLNIAIIEDDGSFANPFINLVQCKKFFSYISIDEAYEEIILKEKHKDIDIYLIDIFLPLPKKISLGTDALVLNAGIYFHKFLEKQLEKDIPVVFYSAFIENHPNLKKLVFDYIKVSFETRKFFDKLERIENMSELIKQLNPKNE